MVINFDDLLREAPENRNVYLPNEKSIYTEVKTESGWEKKERDQTLNETFKNSAKLLYDTKETIDNTNKKLSSVERLPISISLIFSIRLFKISPDCPASLD